MHPVNVSKAAASHEHPTLSLSKALENQDKATLIECIESMAPCSTGDFAALCLDFPDLALLALKKYPHKSLPQKIAVRTATTLGFLPEHQELLLTLIEADMCHEDPELLQAAQEWGLTEVEKLLRSRNPHIV